MNILLQPLLIVCLATLCSTVLSQQYYISPTTSECSQYSNGTCFTLDQLIQTTYLSNGSNLTLTFISGEHVLSQLLDIGNFTSVSLLGSTSTVPVSINMENAIHLENIDKMSIEGLRFTRNTTQFPYVRVKNVQNLYIATCRFNGLANDTILDVLYSTNTTIQGVLFEGNTGTTLAIARSSYVSLENTLFTENNAENKAVLFIQLSTTVQIKNSSFISNIGSKGVISISEGTQVSISNCELFNNTATYGQGIYIYRPQSVAISQCAFIGNKGFYAGAISMYQAGSAMISSSRFTNNSGTTYSAAILMNYVNSVTVVSSEFTDNIASNNAIAIHYSGSISISGVLLKGNSGAYGPGGLFIKGSANVAISESSLVGNAGAQSGSGGIYILETRNVTISDSFFTNNTAYDGGALTIRESKDVLLSQSILTGNSAIHQGGGILVWNSVGITISKCELTKSNVAVITSVDSSLMINGTNIRNNSTPLDCQNSTVSFMGDNMVSYNAQPLSVFASTIKFDGPTILTNNGGTLGGAIQATQSQVYFKGEQGAMIIHNGATSGGGIFLRQSKLFVHSPLTITENKADYGGAIYAYQSTIQFQDTTDQKVMIANNSAFKNGGGIYAAASTITTTKSFVLIQSNTALYGGGIFLEENSVVFIQRVDLESQDIRLEIIKNQARIRGGGIYVSDMTNSRACRGTSFGSDCFLQTIDLNTLSYGNYINTFIKHNTALYGSAIYGGLLDRCRVQAEQFTNGLEYVKNTVEFSNDSSISTDPLQLKFCDSELTPIITRKGEPFRLRVVAIDQAGNPVNATIHSSVVTNSGLGIIKIGQKEQIVGSECTELEYNVFSKDSSAQLDLYAVGPCNDLGLSKLSLIIVFLDCTCPLGFHPSQSIIECSCECDSGLQAVKCYPSEETFEQDETLWTGVVNNGTGYIIHECVLDYCVNKPVNISLNNPLTLDRQCAYNRSGILCGECKEGLSLVLAGSECKECSNTYLLLVIPFALMGVVLIGFILWLNITTATGTIYGLIFYANIIATNKTVFLQSRNFLTVFVSWVSLDLGIETCFYNGMNSQAKVLLQLGFPAYVLALTGLLLILSKHVKQLTKLLSKRRTFAVACTVVILSYSKLIRIFPALQWTTLLYPDGLPEIRWLYDPNLRYSSASLVPMFIVIAVIIIVSVLFIALLFFGHCFSYCHNWRFMKWTKNVKYTSFMDAFSASFKPKHRYWVGLLLLALFVQNIVTAVATTTSVSILTAGCLVLVLLFVKTATRGVYKTLFNDILETAFLLNVAILAYGTLYLRVVDGKQQPLTDTSLAIAFMLFLLIIYCHFYSYVLKKTAVGDRLVQKLKCRRNYSMVHQELAEAANEDGTENDNGMDNTYMDKPTFKEDKGDYSLTPHVITQNTSRPDQLGDLDLDIKA